MIICEKCKKEFLPEENSKQQSLILSNIKDRYCNCNLLDSKQPSNSPLLNG